MATSEIAIWLKEQRELGLSTEEIEEKFDELIESI